MLQFLLATMMMTSPAEIPPEIWNCRNQIEVWCSVDSCAASAEDETTPMDISASRSDGQFSICAYSGCWEGQAEMVEAKGRLLWVADNVGFSTSTSGFVADISLLILEVDGVGFVRVGGLATPLLCTRSAPGHLLTGQED